MMKIDFSNMPKGSSRPSFIVRYYANLMRSWYFFHIKFPWVKYNGFVRVMSPVNFAKRDISIGNQVQFGPYCNVTTDVQFGNNILLAGNVSFIGKHDHMTSIPCSTIWSSPRGEDEVTIVEDDVWVGHGAIVMAGLVIGKGSIVAAGAVVTKSIPPCEVWGGNPAKKIRDRFSNELDKEKHLAYLHMGSC